MCSKCGKYLENHDEKFCRNFTKYAKNSCEAGNLFAERVETRGFTSKVASGYIKHALEQEGNTHPNSYNPLVRLNHSYDSNNRLAVTTVGYEVRNTVLKQLSVETARDIQRLGQLGLGKQTYWELARISRRNGISFPPGGIKEAWDEKWSVFGSIYSPITLLLFRENRTILPQPTPRILHRY